MGNLTGKTVAMSGYETINVQPHPQASDQALVTITNSYGTTGYVDGTTKVTGNIANLNAGNIKAGVKVGQYNGDNTNCIVGTYTSDANATAAQILSGKTAYVNGVKITGTIASQGAQTITPGTSNKTIASGKYLSGTQTIKGDSNLKASNIKSGVSIFGVAGSYNPIAASLNCVHENIKMRNKTELTLSTTSPIRLIVIGSYEYDGVRGSLYIFPQSSTWMIMSRTGLLHGTASFVGNKLYCSPVGYAGSGPTSFKTSTSSTYYQYIHVAEDLLSATFYISQSTSGTAAQVISIFT